MAKAEVLEKEKVDDIPPHIDAFLRMFAQWVAEEILHSAQNDKIKGPQNDRHKKKEGKYLTPDQVELIHQQLLKNESVLKEFQDKYGLSIETIKNYRIGYQNNHYVIPMQIEPDKWVFKEHKGSQPQGSKVIIMSKPPALLGD